MVGENFCISFCGEKRFWCIMDNLFLSFLLVNRCFVSIIDFYRWVVFFFVEIIFLFWLIRFDFVVDYIILIKV